MKRENIDIHLSADEWSAQLDILENIKNSWVIDFEIKKNRKPIYHIVTFGCQMNKRDSEHLDGFLSMAGFVSGSKEDADFIIYNTCCIREQAELRVFGNIAALNKRKKKQPDLIIGVCGCMMQQKEVSDELYKKYPYVDLIFGTHALYLFPQLLNDSLSGKRVLSCEDSTGRIAENIPTIRKKEPSAFVTVMLGCDNFCSYCIVPYVRGRERSRKPDEIIKEIQELADDGVSEVTLLGQNVNSYGNDFEDLEIDFAQLIYKVAEIEGVKRIRFLSSHPKDLSDSLIDVYKNCDKLCKHIHLAVQSGSNRILELMNRKYTKEKYLERIEKLRNAVPDLEVTTDIIVGFPGESEEDFQDTIDLAKKAKFSAAYTFMYSPRNGTKAAKMADQLSQDEKKRRLHELSEVIEGISSIDRAKYINKKVIALVEERDIKGEKYLSGRIDTAQKVFWEDDGSKVGDYVEVVVEQSRRNSLYGRAIGKKIWSNYGIR